MATYIEQFKRNEYKLTRMHRETPLCAPTSILLKNGSLQKVVNLETGKRTAHSSVQPKPFVLTLPYDQNRYGMDTQMIMNEKLMTKRVYDYPKKQWCTIQVLDRVYFPVGSGYPPLPDAATAGQHNEAKLKLAMKVQDARALLPVTLYKWNETINSISDRLKQIGRALWAIKSGKISKAVSIMGVERSKQRSLTMGAWRNSKRLASDRLEYAYMWGPTLGEVEGLAIMAAQNMLSKPHMLKASTVVSQDYLETKVTSGITVDLWLHKDQYVAGVGTFPSINCGFTGYDTKKLTLKYWVLLKLLYPALRNVDQSGLLNPLPTAWELIPFSFVLDQFIPIGDYLSSLTAYSGFEYVDGGYSQLRRADRRGIGYGTWEGSESSNTAWVTGFNSNYTRYRLLQSAIKPQPPLRNFEFNQSVGRILNNLALARVVLFK